MCPSSLVLRQVSRDARQLRLVAVNGPVVTGPSRSGSSGLSAVAVEASSVVDSQDLDPVRGVVDLAEHPVRSSAGAVGAFEVCLERVADLSGGPCEVAEDELDDRRNDAWRDALQVPARGGREDHLIAHRSPLGTLNSARICSSPYTRPASTSASASAIDSRIPCWDSQNSVSWIDSHSSNPIRTAAADPFLVIVTCSRVLAAASTSSLSLSLTLEIGSVLMPRG